MRKILSVVLALAMLLSATAAFAEVTKEESELDKLLPAGWWNNVEVKKSETCYFENGLNITAMGVHFNSYPTDFDGCFYFPTIEKMTNAHIAVDWRVIDGYSTQVSTTLASQNLPDIMQAGDFGITSLAAEGAIIALDDYLDLIPNVAAAVGEDRIADWASADGHIYAIPTIVNVPGSQSVMIRQDWADALKAAGKIDFDQPTTWEQWKQLWYAIRDNDCNGNGDATDEIPLALEMGANGERCLQSLLNAFGIAASSDSQFCLLDDGTYTMVYEHPRYKEFLTEIQKLYADKIIDPEFATRTQAELFTAMDSNLVGTSMTWAERAKLSSYSNQAAGAANALWSCVAPITGPHGDQMTQARQAVTNRWCITVAAEKAGKVEDILKFFNWQFSDEGVMLYNYGIEGCTYDMKDGIPTLKPEVVANGFVEYRKTGMEYEPFGGLWQTNAFMQCLFAGKSLDELDAPNISFYNGLNDQGVNKDKYYAMPPTLETEEYTEYRAELITTGVCTVRDQCIAGQISVDDFFTKYQDLKDRGLNDVIDAGSAAYALLVGGNK